MSQNLRQPLNRRIEMNEIVKIDNIKNRIFLIRGVLVILHYLLAEIYGVKTKRLNEQVKRNISRFPEDFRFQLTDKEKIELVAICDRFKNLKYSSVNPYTFTDKTYYVKINDIRIK